MVAVPHVRRTIGRLHPAAAPCDCFFRERSKTRLLERHELVIGRLGIMHACPYVIREILGERRRFASIILSTTDETKTGCSLPRAKANLRCRKEMASCSVARASMLLNSILVDPASSHMLDSKIKPCTCQYNPTHGETADGSLDQLWFLRTYIPSG